MRKPSGVAEAQTRIATYEHSRYVCVECMVLFEFTSKSFFKRKGELICFAILSNIWSTRISLPLEKLAVVWCVFVYVLGKTVHRDCTYMMSPISTPFIILEKRSILSWHASIFRNDYSTPLSHPKYLRIILRKQDKRHSIATGKSDVQNTEH